MTNEEIEAKRTPRGGWTRAQLAEWGVPWPPPKGWRRRLVREPYQKPTVTRVRLDAKEMAVSACKIVGGGAHGPGGSCRRPSGHGACRGQGS